MKTDDTVAGEAAAGGRELDEIEAGETAAGGMETGGTEAGETESDGIPAGGMGSFSFADMPQYPRLGRCTRKRGSTAK